VHCGCGVGRLGDLPISLADTALASSAVGEYPHRSLSERISHEIRLCVHVEPIAKDRIGDHARKGSV